MSIELNEGTYMVRVVGQEVRESKGGSLYFSLKVEVLDTGKNRFIPFYFSEKTAERSLSDLKELGFDKPGFQYLDPSIEGFHDFAGVEFEAYCKHEEYQGEAKEKWQKSFYKSEPADKDKLRSLNSMFGSYLPKKKGPPVAKAPTPKPTPKPEPVAVGADGDDDIPF
jgi:hypothetical protein